MKKIALIICIILVALPFGHLYAQAGFGSGISDAVPAGGGGGGGGGGHVPLDGGLSLLVVAGVGYAAKKMKGKGKHSEAKVKAIQKYIYK